MERRLLRAALVRPLLDRDSLKIAVKANAGRYARVPSFIELYGNGTAVVAAAPPVPALIIVR